MIALLLALAAVYVVAGLLLAGWYVGQVVKEARTDAEGCRCGRCRGMRP